MSSSCHPEGSAQWEFARGVELGSILRLPVIGLTPIMGLGYLEALAAPRHTHFDLDLCSTALEGATHGFAGDRPLAVRHHYRLALSVRADHDRGYSRFVGGVFWAPLAMEALLAFFLESTFLGLRIFGWDKLSPRLHAACLWLVSIGTLLSALFIMSANSFMQHPVGITVNPERSRAEVNDIWVVLTQPLNVYAYAHVIPGAVLSGAAIPAGISSYFLLKHCSKPAHPRPSRSSPSAAWTARPRSSPSGFFRTRVSVNHIPESPTSVEIH